MSESRKNIVERLFSQHGRSLQSFISRRLGGRPTDAAELAQEVYVRMLRLSDLDSIRNPEAYLYAVAGNLAKEQAQRGRAAGIAVDIDDPSIQNQLAELPTAPGELDRERRVARLREVIDQLSPKCRAALILQYWHGLRYQEIALRLGVSSHMVKKYLSQGLTHCRRRMARLG